MKNAINKELAGYIQPGECWHRVRAFHSGRTCDCGIRIPAFQSGKHPCDDKIIDYFTKSGFAEILMWATKQDWWFEFNNFLPCMLEEILDNTKFAYNVYEFLKGAKQ